MWTKREHSSSSANASLRLHGRRSAACCLGRVSVTAHCFRACSLRSKMSTTRIILPLPPRDLHPNARVHWAAKARATKQARQTGYVAARVAWGLSPPPCWPLARVTATFYFKTNRKQDRDNLIAWLKSYIDGLEDFGIIDDDTNLLWGEVEWEVSKSDPRVELEVVPE